MKKLLAGIGVTTATLGAAFFLFILGKVAYASNVSPEFSAILSLVSDGWADLLDFAYKVIKLVIVG